MKEYFVVANSFAAPFFSDEEEGYIKGKSPRDAMQKFVKKYSHPCGLYSAVLFTNADAFHKNKKPLCKYLCNLELEKQRLTKNLKGFSFKHESISKDLSVIEIDYKKHSIRNPRGGKILVAKEAN